MSINHCFPLAFDSNFYSIHFSFSRLRPWGRSVIIPCLAFVLPFLPARERQAAPRFRTRLRELFVWGGATAATAAVCLALLEPAIHFRHGLFAVAALVIAGLALVLPVALATVLGGGRPREVRPRS